METRHQIFFSDASHMADIEPESISLVVTSPPYPMIAMWDQAFGGFDPRIAQALADARGKTAFALMHRVLDTVWEQIHRVLIPGGIACINIGDATRTINNQFRLFPNHVRIISAFYKLGCTMLPAVIWRKPTNAPNKFMGSGMLPPNAYVTLEHEYILIFRKKGRRSLPSDDEKMRRYDSAYFWEERNKWFSDIWFDLVGSTQSMHHEAPRGRSAAFPFELPYRLIHMFSIKGDIVLDPFLGTGTTMLAAMCAGRSSIGFEIDAALQPFILQRITSVPSIARQTVDQRLKAHCDFVNQRLEDDTPPKHHNANYDLPVITKQETKLQLDLASQVEYLSGNRFKVTYQPTGKENIPAPTQTKTSNASPADSAPEHPKERQLMLF